MSLPTGEIQTALVARYRDDSTLQGLLGNPINPPGAVFDQGGVQTNQPFPYLVVYEITSISGTTLAMGQDAVDSYIQVSVFTQAGGLSNARAIAKQVYALTQVKPVDLSASGFAQFFVLFENEQQKEEPDGLTQQIIHRYHFMTQTIA